MGVPIKSPSILPFRDIDIRATVSRNAYARAIEIVNADNVVAIDVSADGRTITSAVQGSERRPYRQTIHIRQLADGRRSIEGSCSCPMAFNCKHVGAVLLALLFEEDDRYIDDDEPAVSKTPPLPQPLPPLTRNWIESLDKAAASGEDEYPEGLTRRALYVLALDTVRAGVPRLSVEPRIANLRKDGTFSEKADRVNVAFNPDNPAQYLRPVDRDILRGLNGIRQNQYGGMQYRLAGEAGMEVLRLILSTGRARLGSHKGLALSEGPPVPATFGWVMADDGSQVPNLDAGPRLKTANLCPPIAIDEESGTVHPVSLPEGMNATLAEAFLAAPAIEPEHAGEVAEALQRQKAGSVIPALRESLPIRLIDVKPVPKLELFVAKLPDKSWNQWYYSSKPRARVPSPVARTSFIYGEMTVLASDTRPEPSFARNGELVRVRRSPTRENAALKRLRSSGLTAVTEVHGWDIPDSHRGDLTFRDDASWIAFLHDQEPVFRRDGWQIAIAEDFPFHLVPFSGEIEARPRESSGIDWFDLELGTMVDGKRVDLIPVLIGLIRNNGAELVRTMTKDGELFVKLDEKRILPVPGRIVKPLFESLLALFDMGFVDDGGNVRFSRFSAAELARFEEEAAKAGLKWRGGEALRTLGKRLAGTGGIPALEPPSELEATLRPYQARGIDWLQFLREGEFGGVLADDMGLGKTIQTLAHLLHEKQAGRLDRPALVICPTSLVANWLREAASFAPSLKVMALHGLGRHENFSAIPDQDLIVTTYPLITRDHEKLAKQPWHIVVLDEAQMIKNPGAVTTKLVGTLEARQRLALTGTPLENHLGELWSLFSFVAPGYLGDKTSFAKRYRTPIEKKGNTARRQELARRVRPFMLRRTKAEVASDLPAKTDIPEPVSFEEAQRALYESVRLAMHERVREAVSRLGLKRSSIIILDALLKLRQICCDPRLVTPQTPLSRKARSAKLARLMELVPALLEEGRRILLFSQFTSMLALIQEELNRAKIPYVLLTGDTKDRATPVNSFQAGKVPLFLISLKAGGFGLNLTAADTVIHYDPWWNPAVENQATDRAHRIGQTKPVFVHKLVCQDTVEEKIEALKARKADLAAGILDEEHKTALDLTEEDIDALFG